MTRSPLFQRLRPWLVLVALLASVAPTMAASDPRVLLQLVDYVGVDYPEAVQAGEIVNPAEYAEMLEFAASISDAVDGLEPTPARERLAEEALAVAALVDARGESDALLEITRSMRSRLLRAYPVELTPRSAPSLERGARLFQANCAACHGVEGRGDGRAAAHQDPPPIDFHDAERARQRSLYGLFNTITLGVEGTAMPSFSDSTEQERWDLAFYVGSLWAADVLADVDTERVSSGRQALTLREAVSRAPVELESAHLQAETLIAWSRRHPESLFQDRMPPLTLARARIEESLNAFSRGDRDEARNLAISAYLDGFELVEPSLKAKDAELTRAVEQEMMAYRAALGDGVSAEAAAEGSEKVVALLGRAEGALGDEPLSPTLAFASAWAILLREGLEAILVLGAIFTLLVRTGRRDALPYFHLGWAAALVGGLLTWAAATWLIDFSGAAREVTEGAAALLAAAVLFGVGFWMHDKIHAERWNHYVRTRVERALDGRALFGISAIAFLAVYREAFETVLFYQALWAQAGSGGGGVLIVGAAVAGLCLLLLGWAIFRLGLRLPLRQFFAWSGLAMFGLAVIFAGKGVVALQEAGHLPMTPIQGPRIDLLGLYPTVQGLAIQVCLALAAIALMAWARRGARTPV